MAEIESQTTIKEGSEFIKIMESTWPFFAGIIYILIQLLITAGGIQIIIQNFNNFSINIKAWVGIAAACCMISATIAIALIILILRGAKIKIRYHVNVIIAINFFWSFQSILHGGFSLNEFRAAAAGNMIFNAYFFSIWSVQIIIIGSLFIFTLIASLWLNCFSKSKY